jgi:hypothetical protein
VFQKLKLHDQSLFTKLCTVEKFPANFHGCISVFWYAIAARDAYSRLVQ